MSLLPPDISVCSLSIRRPSTVIHIYIGLSCIKHTYRLLGECKFPVALSLKVFARSFMQALWLSFLVSSLSPSPVNVNQARATVPVGIRTFKVDFDREDLSLFRIYSLLAFPVTERHLALFTVVCPIRMTCLVFSHAGFLFSLQYALCIS